MEEIKTGDIVQLKSGSPVMTVERVDDLIYCVYFYEGDCCRASFKPISLQKVHLSTKLLKNYNH